MKKLLLPLSVVALCAISYFTGQQSVELPKTDLVVIEVPGYKQTMKRAYRLGELCIFPGGGACDAQEIYFGSTQ